MINLGGGEHSFKSLEQLSRYSLVEFIFVRYTLS